MTEVPQAAATLIRQARANSAALDAQIAAWIEQLVRDATAVTKLSAFFAPMSEDQIGEYLYSHSVCDIANDVGVLPDDVRAWVSSYMEA